jgi:cell division septation protein DedD
MDKALKQRLVGASVLIILAVIVLPMLLSGRSDTLKQESREIEIPPKPEELSIQTRRFPVGIPGQSAATSKEAPAADVVEEQQQAATPVETVKLPVTASDKNALTQTDAVPDEEIVLPPENTELPATESQAPQTAVTEKPGEAVSIILGKQSDQQIADQAPVKALQDTPRYLVQVASFSSEKNANALAGRLQADNLPVLMDVVERPAGLLHRVRVGPYIERSDADAVVSGLRSTMTELKPRVLDLRPDESAPVSTPSDPLVRWVVQVGSFSKSASADALVAKLRLAGLPAFAEKVSGAGGTAYKVRIGPEVSRERAAELARKVKAEHNLDAFVTTQE